MIKRAKRAVIDSAAPRDGPGSIASLYGFLVESLTEYAVFAISPAGAIISWNAGASRIFGYPQTEIVGQPLSTIFTAEDVAAGEPARELQAALADHRTIQDRWHLRKNGSRFWGTNTVEPLYDATGAMLGYTKLVRDTTDSYLALQALADSEERLRLLVDSVPDYAILSTDMSGVITIWNGGARNTFGYDADDVIGTNVSKLFDVQEIAPTTRDTSSIATLAKAGYVERWLTRKDNIRFLCSIRITRLESGPQRASRGFVMLAHDITERYLAVEELQHRALYDELTRLPNRTSFHEHVGRAIALMRRHADSLFAVLFIDIDHFKDVNDTLGHLDADIVLELIARRLERCVRSEDVVARLSGDEFAILLNGIGGLLDATDAAARVHGEMSRPLEIGPRAIATTVSVGIALGESRYDTPTAILRDADRAMYSAKEAGRARSSVFDAKSNSGDTLSFEFSSALRQAVERDELVMQYQPIIRLDDCSLSGFEALVRWNSPNNGYLKPSRFVPHAEQSGAIIAIDRWVFAHACAQLAKWSRQHPNAPGLAMSINISGRQFSQPDFITFLQRTLEHTGVKATAVRLEITESAIMERSARATALIDAIRDLGITLHADDFGTGYSSLSSLQHMPVGALKIDRSFVSGMDARSGSELVRTIVTLAHNLGMDAIAEGIETVAQLHRLTELGCEYGQGYLFSAPLDAAAAGTFIDTTAKAVAEHRSIPQ